MLINGDSLESELDQKTGRDVFDPKTSKPTLVVCTEHLEVPAQPMPVCSVHLLEHQVNDLTTKLEQYQEASDVQYKKNNEKLTKLLDVITLMTPPAVSPVQGPGSGLISPIGQQIAPVADGSAISNHMPTPELLTIITKAPTISVTKDLGTYQNAGHTHNTWYHMLGISAAKEIWSFYKDEHGNPDVFPEQFVDPVTKYCRPFPHWGKVFQKQGLWVPTYIDHFIGLIPKEGKLAACLKSFSEEDIVALLFNGLWKTAQSAWHTAGKTDADIQTMQAHQASIHRAERKAVTRAKYRKKIETVFLFHAGYMWDEQEENGTVIVKQPSHWATWVNNFYKAVRVAEAQKLKVWPGSTPLPCKISSVKLPIPSLWGMAVAKPDISDFLLQNSQLDDQLCTNSKVPIETEKVEQHPGVVGDEPGHSEGGDYDGAYGRHALSDDIPDTALELDIHDQPGHPLTDCATEHPTELQDNISAPNIPIDPQLLRASHLETSHESQGDLGAPVPPTNASTHYMTGSTMYQAQQHPFLIPVGYPHAAMPPPPLPDAGAAIGSTQPQPATASLATEPKKRRQPKGSKNKPKVPATN